MYDFEYDMFIGNEYAKYVTRGDENTNKCMGCKLWIYDCECDGKDKNFGFNEYEYDESEDGGYNSDY